MSERPSDRTPNARDLDRLVQRAHRYWFEDGLPEVATGLLLVGVALYLYLLRVLEVGGLGRLALEVGLPVLLVAGALCMGRLVMAAKERFTFPRSGRVTYAPASPVRQWVSGATAAGLASLTVWASATLGKRSELPAEAWAPLFAGLLVGVAYMYLGHRLALGRFYAIALLAALYGALSGTSAVGPTFGIVILFGALGATVVASGLLTLARYMRRTASRPEA